MEIGIGYRATASPSVLDARMRSLGSTLEVRGSSAKKTSDLSK
jgi:hypothetical protein